MAEKLAPSSQMTDFAPVRFSTGALPARERVPIWREMFGRKFVNMDIEPQSEASFEAEATLRALPGLRTFSYASTPGRQRRTPELIGNCDDSIGLPINAAGTMSWSQRGHDVSLGAGDAVLVLHTEPGMMIHSHMQGTGLAVPCAALAPLTHNLEDAAMQVIPRDNELLRLLARYLETVREELALGTPELQRLITTHIYDLVAAIVGATRDGAALAAERGLPAARIAAIKADIVAHLGSRELSLTALAARHKVSPRSIQLLFDRTSVTFSQFVLEQRLARARRMLTDPRLAGATVSAIALGAGFGDLSHFNRSFRRRYGTTPSDVRASA